MQKIVFESNDYAAAREEEGTENLEEDEGKSKKLKEEAGMLGKEQCCSQKAKVEERMRAAQFSRALGQAACSGHGSNGKHDTSGYNNFR